MKFFKATIFISYALAVLALPPPLNVPVGKECQKALDANTNSSVAKCFKLGLSNNLAYCKDPVCANFKVPADIAEACVEEREAINKYNFNLEKDFSNFHTIISSRCVNDMEYITGVTHSLTEEASSSTAPAPNPTATATPNPQNSQNVTGENPASSDASKLTYSVLAASLAVAANLLL